MDEPLEAVERLRAQTVMSPLALDAGNYQTGVDEDFQVVRQGRLAEVEVFEYVAGA